MLSRRGRSLSISHLSFWTALRKFLSVYLLFICQFERLKPLYMDTGTPKKRALYDNTVVMRGECRLCSGPYCMPQGPKSPFFTKTYVTGWCPTCIRQVETFHARGGLDGRRPNEGYPMHQAFVVKCASCLVTCVEKVKPAPDSVYWCPSCADEVVIVGVKAPRIMDGGVL